MTTSHYHLSLSSGLEYASPDFTSFVSDLLAFADAYPGRECRLSDAERTTVNRMLEMRDELMTHRAREERTTLPPPASDEWDRRSDPGGET